MDVCLFVALLHFERAHTYCATNLCATPNKLVVHKPKMGVECAADRTIRNVPLHSYRDIHNTFAQHTCMLWICVCVLFIAHKNLYCE